MPRTTPALTCVLWTVLAAPGFAQLAPPTIRIARPFSVAPGAAVVLEVRGTNLDGASGLWFDAPGIESREIKLADGTDARLGRKLTASIRLPANLAPGLLQVRVVSPRGLSNPAPLRVGRTLSTLPEQEPNDHLKKAQAVSIPVAIEGAIEPGDDVDLFAVDLKAGETIVAEAIAARGGSGLDPLLTIFTPEGRELAADDDTFGRDAAVSATARVPGRYVVQLQDANGRNRDNNIEQKMAREYRLEIGRLPLVTGVFPAGGRRGERTVLHLSGANLPEQGEFLLDPPAGTLLGDTFLSLDGANPFMIRVGEFPEVREAEPNHDVARLPEITVPVVINGGLATGDDGDLFRLRAAPGQEGEYRITAYAARIGSPADPVLTVLDDKGDPQGEDDDKLGRDARLERTIDSTAGIVLAVRDYYNRGGPRFLYRVEVEPIGRRGATVTAAIGACALPRGGSVALPFTIDRRNYEGPVTLLTGALPNGVTATPVTVGPKANGAFLVLSAASDVRLGPFPLRLVTRDLPMSAETVIREPTGVMSPALLAVAEPAPIGVRLGPAAVVVPPGGQAVVKVRLDRRGGVKKAVKVRVVPLIGEFEGFEAPPELTIAADAAEASVTLKAKPDASPRQLAVAARARFEDAAEALGVCSAPIDVVVPERPK